MAKLSRKQLKAMYMAQWEKDEKARKQFVRATGRTQDAKAYARLANYIRFNCPDEFAAWKAENYPSTKK